MKTEHTITDQALKVENDTVFFRQSGVEVQIPGAIFHLNGDIRAMLTGAKPEVHINIHRGGERKKRQRFAIASLFNGANLEANTPSVGNTHDLNPHEVLSFKRISATGAPIIADRKTSTIEIHLLTEEEGALQFMKHLIVVALTLPVLGVDPTAPQR